MGDHLYRGRLRTQPPQDNFSDEHVVELAWAACICIFGSTFSVLLQTDLGSAELTYDDTLTNPDGNVVPQR